ncbi:cell division protein ZipA [Testudinibacter sp. P27/CKL/0425]
MDLHIILIILIVLILLILVAHGLWSSRREKSQMFKSANTFTYDSRTEGQDLLDRDIEPIVSPSQPLDHGSAPPAANHNYPETQPIPQVPQQPVSTPVSVEQAVSNIRITLPQQADAASTDSHVAYTSPATPSAVSEPANRTESLSRSSLLNRTIADLEQEIDSEEGINTSSGILREELARATQQAKIHVSETTIDSEVVAAPTSAAESMRAQLNPEPQPQADHLEPKNEKPAAASDTQEKPKTLMLYIVAPSSHGFQGSQVVQSLEGLGFLFGQHSLYHRHLDLDGNSPILFSAANMMKPGIFDPENLADFRTAGLVLFMHLPSPGSDLANFRLLLRAAQTLAQQLGGEVLNDKRQPFDENSKNNYLQLIN